MQYSRKKNVRQYLGKSVEFDDFIIIRPLHNYRMNSGVIIVKDEQHPVVIDTGTPQDPGMWRIESAFHQHHINPATIKYICITHGHPDHYMNLSRLNRFCKHAKVIMHHKEYIDIYNPAHSLSNWNNAIELINPRMSIKRFSSVFAIPIMMLLYRTVSIFPRIHYTIGKSNSDITSNNVKTSNEPTIKSGNLRLKFIPTVGHSLGHCSILDNHKNLYVGDFVPFTPWIDFSPRSLDEMIHAIKRILLFQDHEIRYIVRSHGDIRVSNPRMWEVFPWSTEKEKYQLFLDTIQSTLENIPQILRSHPGGLSIRALGKILIPNYAHYNIFMRYTVPPSLTWIGTYLLKLEQEHKVRRKIEPNKIKWIA